MTYYFDYDDDYDFEAAWNAHPGAHSSAADLKWGLRYGMGWRSFEDNIKVFPQHAQSAQEEIERHLGFKPMPEVSFRHEPFIRALIEEHKQGRLNQKEFNDAVAIHVRHIRNDYVQRCGWAAPYTPEDYDRYNNYLPQFKEKARQRLTQNLDFEPALEYTIDAELILRDLFIYDGFTGEPYIRTEADCLALTIMFYRMAMIEAGREVANEIDLMGIVE